jgi:hypothetical protein
MGKTIKLDGNGWCCVALLVGAAVTLAPIGVAVAVLR